MQQKISLQLSPANAANERGIIAAISSQLSTRITDIHGYNILKRSIDARGKNILINLTLLVYLKEPYQERKIERVTFRDVHHADKTIIIIGAGPAGLFAALKLIEAGIRPIILERGKDVQSRRRDLALLNKKGILNPESNYCFGEGGAGTYSDGKLYTRSNKRGDINRILNLFVQFGAPEEILFEAHPHIGTNKLPQIINSMRETISGHGGLLLFEKKVTRFEFDKGKLNSVCTADGDSFPGDSFILATGHSARDIFELLHTQGIQVQPKPFALGVRVEHPQSIINTIQYHGDPGTVNLPPASYSLVHQSEGKGIFSFCMCPGGIIAPASTDPGAVVVNGWSPSKRNNPFANSGMVVEVSAENAFNATRHLKIRSDDPLLFMHFQKLVEENAFNAGGGRFVAPAQRMVDFTRKHCSENLPVNSYLPGLKSAALNEVLPPFIFDSLSNAFKAFGKKMNRKEHGFFTNDAVVVATESRTSSPVRIPRQEDTLAHPQLKNLFPCGEGAGYAGGIVSAAMDGERVASVIIEKSGS